MNGCCMLEGEKKIDRMNTYVRAEMELVQQVSIDMSWGDSATSDVIFSDIQ